MTDVLSVDDRSALMARIRGTGNESTEVAMIKMLRQAGLSGWRRHVRIGWQVSSLSPSLQRRQHKGRFRAYVAPDFVFRKKRTVLFVDGCFWHACPTHGGSPSSNSDYWRPKLLRNRTRDRFVDAVLCHRGWIVLRVWEHELSQPQQLMRWLVRNLQASNN